MNLAKRRALFSTTKSLVSSLYNSPPGYWSLIDGISLSYTCPFTASTTAKNYAIRPTSPFNDPVGANILQQQAKFDTFVEEFNHEKPHEALAMQCPAEIYSASCRGIPEAPYPFHDRTVVVTRCGRICLGSKKINFSQVFAGRRHQGGSRRHLAAEFYGL